MDPRQSPPTPPPARPPRARRLEFELTERGVRMREVAPADAPHGREDADETVEAGYGHGV